MRPIAAEGTAVVMAAGVSDSSLGALNVSNGSMTALAPAFDPANLVYHATANDDASATLAFMPGSDGATATVSVNGSLPVTAVSGASIPLTRNRNDIVLKVTSSDATTNTTYKVSVWRLAAPIPRIVRLANAHATVYGGVYMTVTLADGVLPTSCNRDYQIGGQYGWVNNYRRTYDALTGLTTEMVYIRSATDYAPGAVDIQVRNYCYPGAYVESITTVTGGFTYTPGFPIDSAEIPATVTSGTKFVFHGTDVNAYADVTYWIEDAQGVREELEYWDWTGNDNSVQYVDYADYDDWYKGSGVRTLHAGICGGGQNSIAQSNDAESDESAAPPKGGGRDQAAQSEGGGLSECTSFFTQAINWVEPKPTDVSFSPASGSVLGGTTVRVKGRFLDSGGDGELTFKIGDQVVSDHEVIYAADDDYSTFEQYLTDYDIVEFVTPPAASAGPVTISATNFVGTTTARGTFTYSAKPTITSIAPTTVANSGGSVLTVLGTNFGATGRPTVIIGGIKSPSVTRVSATKLTAVVPDLATIGPVDVTVVSQLGGGVSTAATLTMVAVTTLPTATTFSPASGKVGDEVTVTGTGFGAAGTAGLSVDGRWARVTANTATSITFEVPATDTTGSKPVVIGTTTGTLGVSNAFTVLPDAGISAVSPATVASYASGAGAKITLTGAGFGTKGTVKVGTAAAVAYTSNGTSITGVVVPTSAAGSLPIVVTPTGVTTALRSSVRVTGPALTYVGPNPRDVRYGPADINVGDIGFVLDVPTTGGSLMRVEGSGFGTAGVLTLGATAVTTTSWTDSAITFTAPARTIGTFALRVAPTGSSLSASRAEAVHYVAPITGLPAIVRIASVVDHGRNDRNEFDALDDLSDTFTISGANLAGSLSSATRVTVTNGGEETFVITPSAVTPTSLTFAAPRGFTNGGWKAVQVTTDAGIDRLNYGMYYLNAGMQITINPWVGLCLRSSTDATGSVSYDPAVVTIANTGGAFGAGGAVTIDGVAVVPSSYTAGEIVFSMATLASELPNPWGGKRIVITPTDTDLPAQSAGFTCGVTPSVATTLNGSTDPLTIAAGTTYTPGYTTTGIIGTSAAFTATAPGGYEYVTASEFVSNGFQYNVRAGAPAAAGDYYVRVALSRATYAAEKYFAFSPAPVHLTITGTPIIITPEVNGSGSFVYSGELGDGTGGSPDDFDVVPSLSVDPITSVQWEYRDQVCSGQGADAGWTDGLPGNVAMSAACGGNGVTRSGWEVRVKSFEMKTSGTDRSVFYVASRPSVEIEITPRNLTVDAVRADRVYDGTAIATFGEITFTGAVEGDNVSLDNAASTGLFGDTAPGVNKPVTLAADLVLAGSAKSNYTLTNPRPPIVGTITRASAVLSLASSTSQVLLTQNGPVTITPTVKDVRTGQVVADEANASPVVLTSQTPSVCTVSGMTVNATTAGTCTITGAQAISVNYLAAVAASDESSTTETIEIEVLAAPQTIAVVADDITAAVGDEITFSAQVSGLFDGDEVTGVEFDVYDGDTLVASVPTEPGTFRIIAKGGSLRAANNAAYTNPNTFTYVAGTLELTALPPTITTVSPSTGFTKGGTVVTVTGTRLDTVRSVRIGGTTLRAGSFTVNDDGTSLTFTTPSVPEESVVDIILVAGTASAQDVFTYTEEPVEPVTATVPGIPRSFTAVGGDQWMTMRFLAPSWDGDSDITSYQASYDGGTTWKTVATTVSAGGTRSFTVKLLHNGTTYSVQVRAVNDIGPGTSTTVRKVLVNGPKPPAIVHPASEIAIPANPDAYRGAQKYTRARNTSYNGSGVYPITSLGNHQLTKGEGGTLSKKGLFGFDSAVLTALGRSEVKLLASRLIIARAVTCEGYTDYAGQAAHELTLSRQRAAAVCAALIKYGADVRTATKGYGQARPVIVGGTAASREANRRVVVIVTG